MTYILLIGTDLPLLEGLAQTFASLGFSPLVAQSVNEGRDLAAQHPPLVVLLSRSLTTTGAETLTIPLAGGGARLLYHSPGSPIDGLLPCGASVGARRSDAAARAQSPRRARTACRGARPRHRPLRRPVEPTARN